METDAKGQLGGLDTTEADRRRCAEGSGVWKCASCGRSNAEILKECEDAAKLQEADGESSRNEEKVPEGLVIGSREELGLQFNGADVRSSQKDEETEAELAEGFVQTAPPPPQLSSYPSARPAQTVPRPTATRPSTSQPAPAIPVQRNMMAPIAQAQVQQRVSPDGVPVWVDRAIVGIVLCLVFMITKMMLGY